MKNKRLLSVFLVLISFGLTARADVVADWNAIAVQPAVAAGSSRPGPSASLDIAMVHLAIYDAVQAVEGDYEPYYVDIPNTTGSPIAAAAKAAHDVLVSRFPAQTASLDVAYTNYLIANGILVTDPGIAVGQRAAAGILALRACDGAFPNPAPPPFTGGTAIGQWRPTAPTFSPMNPGPWLGSVTPFLLTKPTQFRSDPPPSLISRQYARDYNEVKAYGALNNSARSPEQTDMAYFWAGNFTVMMNATLRQVAVARLTSVSSSSRMFALATAVTADTVIPTWNDKAYYAIWRPDTAIQNGHLDDNPHTVQDAGWLPLIPNPPYPDYVSGANGYTAANMQSLTLFLGRDRMDFDITTTNTTPTTTDTRSFRRFSEVMDEVVDARVFLGIHFRFADEAARRLGKRVARYGYDNYSQRVGRDHDGHNGDDDDLVSQ